jgi:MerR family copper efflux transcriptional regulator
VITTDPPQQGYRIAEVSRLTGFTPSTLRYYESAGVLAPPERTGAGYRLYDDRAVERLRLVARAKDLGCTLEEIAGLVEAWDADDCGPVKHRLRSLVSTKVAQIERHIAEQRALAADLKNTAAILASRPVDGPCDETCGCTAAASECGCSTADELVAVSDGLAAAPPIACTLAGGDMQNRVEDWQTLLHGIAREPIPDGLRLRFPAPAPLPEIARLAEAEQACCAFFTFTITVEVGGVTFDVTAPVDGQSMLDSVFGTVS